MEEKTDKESYLEFLEGDMNGFERIVLEHKNRLIYFIQKYVKDLDIAEDIAQDVFVYVLIHKVHYDFEYSLKTYLYTIAKSKALNYLKREKKILYVDEVQVGDIEELEDIVFKNEKVKNLKHAIKKLKPNFQQAIYLADIEGLTYKEIEKIMQKSNASVKVLIHRARKALKEIVKEEAIKYEE